MIGQVVFQGENYTETIVREHLNARLVQCEKNGFVTMWRLEFPSMGGESNLAFHDEEQAAGGWHLIVFLLNKAALR